MEQQSLVRGIGRKVGLVEQRARDGEPGLVVEAAGLRLAARGEGVAETDEALGGDGRRRAVRRLVVVVGIGRPRQVVAQPRQSRRARVPVGHAVRGRVGQVEVGGGLRDLDEAVEDARLAPEALECALGQRGQELELLGVATQDPGQAARPGGEGREALLGAGTAIGAVVDVEDRLVGDAAADVVRVAAGPEVDVEARGGLGVLEQAEEQRHAAVAFAHQDLAELMGQGQRAQRADGVGEQRVRAVERIDEAQLGRVPRPA